MATGLPQVAACGPVFLRILDNTTQLRPGTWIRLEDAFASLRRPTRVRVSSHEYFFRLQQEFLVWMPRILGISVLGPAEGKNHSVGASENTIKRWSKRWLQYHIPQVLCLNTMIGSSSGLDTTVQEHHQLSAIQKCHRCWRMPSPSPETLGPRGANCCRARLWPQPLSFIL